MAGCPFIIAISGKSGCGNSTVSTMLAERLGVRLVNYTFRNMAQEMGLPFNDVLDMAKRDDSLDRRLDTRQVELAREGDCVIGSRLAIWLLHDAVLRVYLDASDATRAERIRKREGGDARAVLEFTRDRDRADRGRYIGLYGIDNDEYRFADVIVNTERMDPETIVTGLAALAGILRSRKIGA